MTLKKLLVLKCSSLKLLGYRVTTMVPKEINNVPNSLLQNTLMPFINLNSVLLPGDEKVLRRLELLLFGLKII